jgi:RNA polymerase sigma factor (sigma-70 family)
MTDEKLIEDILSGGSAMQLAAEWFYRENLKLVYKESASNRLGREDALDAYSDAVTALVENIRNRVFRGESKCSTYFIRIFSNKCIDIFRKKTTNKSKENTLSLEEMKIEPAESIVNEEANINLSMYFDELSEVCREVLMDWSDGFSMDDIAERNGLKNAHTARSKRYNCFQQLVSILQKKNIVRPNQNAIINGRDD